MHDERRRIEERVARLHDQRIKPAVYAARVPFEVAAWQAPGEPVPFAEAAAAPYTPFAMGTPWARPGARPGSGCGARCPPTGLDRRVESVIDLGFVGDWPGNQAEALVHRTDGTPLKAVNPLNQYVPVARPAAAWGSRRVSGGGRLQPGHPRERVHRAHPARRCTDGRRPSTVYIPPRRPRRSRRGGLAPRPRPPGAARTDAGTGRARPAPATRSPTPSTGPWTCSTWTTSQAPRPPYAKP
ncbi:hypothetical protein ACQ4WX_42110 [Streptomyces lasalocidi]